MLSKDISDKIHDYVSLHGSNSSCKLDTLKSGDIFITEPDLSSDKFIITTDIDTYDGSPMCINLKNGSIRYFDCNQTVIKLKANLQVDYDGSVS